MAKPFYIPQKEEIVSESKDLNKYVRDALISLFSRKYWKPTFEAFDKKLQKLIESGLDNKKALVTILDNLTEVLKNSEPEVMNLIKKSGKDIKQSRVVVAGNNFQFADLAFKNCCYLYNFKQDPKNYGLKRG